MIYLRYSKTDETLSSHISPVIKAIPTSTTFLDYLTNFINLLFSKPLIDGNSLMPAMYFVSNLDTLKAAITLHARSRLLAPTQPLLAEQTLLELSLLLRNTKFEIKEGSLATTITYPTSIIFVDEDDANLSVEFATIHKSDEKNLSITIISDIYLLMLHVVDTLITIDTNCLYYIQITTNIRQEELLAPLLKEYNELAIHTDSLYYQYCVPLLFLDQCITELPLLSQLVLVNAKDLSGKIIHEASTAGYDQISFVSTIEPFVLKKLRYARNKSLLLKSEETNIFQCICSPYTIYCSTNFLLLLTSGLICYEEHVNIATVSNTMHIISKQTISE